MYDLQVNADPTLRPVQEKRQRHREAQRRYRYLIALEASALDDEIPLLEQRLAQLQCQQTQKACPTSHVAWKDIALALEEEALASQEVQRALQQQVAEAETRASLLAAWVQRVTAPPSSPSHPLAGLLDEPVSRATSAVWIMDQLHQRFPQLYAQAPFPRDGASLPFVRVCVSELENTYCTAVHQQYVVPSPLHAVQTACENTAATEVMERLGDDIVYCRGTNDTHNLLIRTIQEPGKFLLLVQGIEDDPRQPLQGYTRSWTSWTMGTTLSDGATLLQKGYDYSGYRVHGAFAPLEVVEPVVQVLVANNVPRTEWRAACEATYQTYYEIEMHNDIAVLIDTIARNGASAT
ncbi:hypothetical protein SPRG_11325 [Saprolegnia parasitica CBS 223.65]|uniref:BZIP domain-containing protein n=1 Tax=Saprolegnia parasitica (strain CBS 223.65) TaxID=695850 RepID=A0A067BVR8_SAPPC|nr:hypothetical protein SPRG_11325 [Saprolegnia parasitica CBS 223.65]KDO22373.1 hypothetical protein SPRG_11325 [Saprolegnia parasitica CBS 223.65]|eukprot:XP_012206897.1 hypothetical protein SPRG_11325 [Saprolegnia parasitica CBS 223.65]